MNTTAIFGKPEPVFIIFRNTVNKIKRPLHCLHCGNKLEYVYEEIVGVVQGQAAIEAVKREIICHKCKAVFEIC